MRKEGTYNQKHADLLESILKLAQPEVRVYHMQGDVSQLATEIAMQLYERGYNIVRRPKVKPRLSPEAQAIVDRFSKKKEVKSE